MNVLVVGGAGYIGSHCCKALADSGYTPITYDNLSRGHEHAVQWGPFVHGDTNDTRKIQQVVIKYNIQSAILLAAFIEVGESIVSPLKFYHNNVANFIATLEGLQGCKAVVFSSTAAVYGNPLETPIKETSLLKPINPYGWSKLMCEQILADQFCSKDGIPYCALRYFNASGADPSGEIGEEHDPETHLIPRACLASMKQLNDFSIYGDDWPTPDGTAIRDYVHVSDLARAHILALEYLLQGAAPDIFNVGIGVGFSVREIISAVERVSGVEMLPTVNTRRAGDPAILLADNNKIKSILGWEPKYNNIQAIVDTAYNFHMKQGIKNV